MAGYQKWLKALCDAAFVEFTGGGKKRSRCPLQTLTNGGRGLIIITFPVMGYFFTHSFTHGRVPGASF